jgi:hypothetical protein
VIIRPDALISASVNNAEVCIDGSAILNANLTGGSSFATLQWQNSGNPAGPFTDISGATAVMYSAPTDQAGIIYYRVHVIDPSSDCSDPNSNVVSVTVRPVLLLPSIMPRSVLAVLQHSALQFLTALHRQRCIGKAHPQRPVRGQIYQERPTAHI